MSVGIVVVHTNTTLVLGSPGDTTKTERWWRLFDATFAYTMSLPLGGGETILTQTSIVSLPLIDRSTSEQKSLP